jgi:hypothetical protein
VHVDNLPRLNSILVDAKDHIKKAKKALKRLGKASPVYQPEDCDVNQSLEGLAKLEAERRAIKQRLDQTKVFKPVTARDPEFIWRYYPQR